MSTTFPPRQAQAGQRITYADAGGTLQRLEAEEVDGRWVIQPKTNGDEAAVRRHKLAIDEDLAAKQAEESKLAGDALEERAKELEIPGRSKMNADQLRQAIAEREAAGEAGDATTPDTQDGADAPSQEE